ncbi:dethiobiotin synthase [Stratiformator vulcanicus]|uniref:ATP-dependent dethiobiotin synthetase BioD n=1 Tax=Stratiformator vulcanicus TaxID=2527980 RepID=A0A517R4A9_9PLAN|nr:dethiobiotin synthase [Stratiformator vulcanicus]QDT38706.1 ATP-dependent dethiobiotin synthetase BioD 1 [Stratiformator vulcanicus]
MSVNLASEAVAKPATGLFVVGTDTDIGKTYVTCLIARQLVSAGSIVGVYKPACSGAISLPDGSQSWGDIEALYAATDGRFERSLICPQRFVAPCAPPVAAAMEGCRVDDQRLTSGCELWHDRCEILLVEGAGGLLSPVSEESTVGDVAGRIDYPLLLVAGAGLGTINHTLLTIEAIERRGLKLAGVILNEHTRCEDDQSVATNWQELAKRTNAPILGRIGHGGTEVLRDDGGSARIDWLNIVHSSGHSARE